MKYLSLGFLEVGRAVDDDEENREDCGGVWEYILSPCISRGCGGICAAVEPGGGGYGVHS